MIGLSSADAIAQHLAAQKPAPVEAPPQTASVARMTASKTMLGVAAMPAPAADSAPRIGGVGQPTTSPEVPAARARTMVGMPVPHEVSQATARASAPPAPTSIPAGGTMLGVAMPGIAPTNPGASPDSSTALPPPPVSAPAVAQPLRSKVANTAISPRPITPAPPPFVDDVPVPRPPARAKPKGIPLSIVIALIAGLVVVGGTVIFLLRPAPKPMGVQPRLDAQGNEVLHLTCDDCPDGTTVTLGESSAPTTVEFKAKEADLPLVTRLHVGENNLTVKINRAGSGRDEEVKLVVPLGFFIRPDLDGIGGKPPVITVRVAAAPGTDVKVDGKPLALDPSGNGAYSIDVTADTEGPTDDVRVLDRKIPYEVVMKGETAPQGGVVTARIAVVALRVDSPLGHRVIDSPSFTVAGQTVAGATVTVGGQAAPTLPDGSFAATLPSPPVGSESAIDVRATAEGRAPRTVHAMVRRVASLDAEAKAADATALVTYDQIAPDVASKVGAHALIAGEVVESRVTGHQTIALVSDTHGCKVGPCLARVIAAEDAKMPRGAQVRAYGTVTRAVTTSSGKTVPELEADFVVRGKR
jgi:hypothetical protein